VNTFGDLGDDEVDEEWDAAWEAYARGAETSSSAPPAPLRAVLRLPAGLVEVRGEVSDEVLGHFVDLQVDPAAPTVAAAPSVAADAPTLDDGGRGSVAVLTVRPGATDDDWHLELSMGASRTGTAGTGAPTSTSAGTVAGPDAARAGTEELPPVSRGSGDSELVDGIVAALERCSSTVDPGHLHLDAACVDLAGVGVVLCGEDRDARDLLLTALLARPGAAYLTSDDVVAQPGTRTVTGTPMPFRVPGAAAPVPASTLAPIVSHCLVGVIVVLDGAEAGVRPLEHAAAVELLAEHVRSTTSAPGLRMELLPGMVAGATCTALGDTPVDDAVGAIAALGPPERRALVVPFVDDRVDPPGNRRGRRAAPERPPVQRMARFDRGAVLDDGVTIRAIPSAQADEFERRVLPSLGERCRPEAFGLANCPIGPVAREAWQGMSILDDLGGSTASGAEQGADESRDAAVTSNGPDEDGAPRGELPTGVAAELLSRNLIESDDAQRARVAERHIRARGRTEQAVRVVQQLLDVAERIGVEPVVVGALVQAFDGPLPEHFTDVDRVDLLVRKEHLDELTEELETRGWVLEARSLSVSSHVVGSERRLHHPDQPTVHVELHRTLASGPFGELVDPEEFHRDAVPFRLGDRWARSLRPEHRFVHACLQADRVDASEGLAELRDVVSSAPRVDERMAQAMECSARWGATTSVLAVVRHADARLPGVPARLAARSTSDGGRSARRRRRRLPRA
jgi:hypothetical protein